MEDLPKFDSTSGFIIQLFIKIGFTLAHSVLQRKSKAFSKLLNTMTRRVSP